MLILFLLLRCGTLLLGAPLTGTDDQESLGPHSLADNHILPRTGVTFDARTTSDIVLSCLATIFACTWTAVHPNIPSPADSRWDVLKRRIVTTTYALLAPEFITFWALRQYIGAKKIEKEYNKDIANQTEAEHRRTARTPIFQRLWSGIKDWLFAAPNFPAEMGDTQPWTTTHGFFVQMGGFVLCKNGVPIQALSFSKSWIISDDNTNMAQYAKSHKDIPLPGIGLKELIEAGNIEVPRTTEAEIEDRSKGDIISKTFVVLQTTWFVAQCIARWATRISVTELEIITLAFALLNGITYLLWWNKPQNVGVPVYLEMKSPTKEYAEDGSLNGSNNVEEESSAVELSRITADTGGNIQTSEELKHLVKDDLPRGSRAQKDSFLTRKLRQDWETKSSSGIKALLLVLYHFIFGVLRPLVKLSEAGYEYVRRGDLRVPMFYAEPLETHTYTRTKIYLGVVAILFGSVHLIPAFFLAYPSHGEKWLWRISGVLITVQPLTLLAAGSIQTTPGSYFHYFIDYPFTLLSGSLTPLYIIARVALIILAFLSLRDLPYTALVAIDWISSIPHL